MTTGIALARINNTSFDSVTGPYSMGEILSVTLGPGAVVGVQGISLEAAAIPEPKTWAMLMIGFGLMAGFAAWGRKRSPRLAV